MRQVIERFCVREDMSTYDPYDIWKTAFGFYIKALFNRNRWLGLVPAAALTVFDTYVNNRLRLFYSRQEYPIIRALAALALMNLFKEEQSERFLEWTKTHLHWLENHSCTGFSGHCWGLNFNYAVTKSIVYDSNTPLATMTPYALEAFIEYRDLSGDCAFDELIRGIFRFFDRDIKVMEETNDYMITSYGPFRDRIVTNAVSYAMYCFAMLLPYVNSDEEKRARERVSKLYAFVRRSQGSDGAWAYSPEGSSFIDCFHSCIVLKNLIKTNRIVPLDGCMEVVERGYRYLQDEFFDDGYVLFRRFSLQNKPSIVKFDLYDNAEMLSLAILLNDQELTGRLDASIRRTFCDGNDIYSQIDVFGRRHNKNTLRWAVMPYVYALSKLYKKADAHESGESRLEGNGGSSLA